MRFPVVMLFAASAVNAQQAPVIVPDAPSCVACTITLKTLVFVGARDGAGALITAPNGVAIDSRGRYWITQESSLPMVYDQRGVFQRTVGAMGDGPGEFRMPYAPTPIGDSVLVFEGAGGRATMISPDLVPGRTMRTPREMGAATIVKWPSLVIGARAMYSRDPKAPTLLRVSFDGAEGKVLSGFGAEPLKLDVVREQHLEIVGNAVAGRVWSADRAARYRLSQWTTDGVLQRQFERKPAWFATDQPGPKPGVATVMEDSTGLVWVFTNVAAPTWKDAMPRGEGQREVAVRSIALEKFMKTIVEVIDPRAGRVVAYKDLGELVVAALPGRRAAIYTVDMDGIARLRIVELSITGR